MPKAKPHARTKHLSIKISAELHRALAEESGALGVPLSTHVSNTLSRVPPRLRVKFTREALSPVK